MKVAATLIVLTATGQCNVSNIDVSEPAAIQMQDAAECEAQAAIIDAQRNIRAFCVPETSS